MAAPTPQDMDLFSIVIETAVPGQFNYVRYANGIFTQIPDSLELTLLSGSDYRIYAAFHQNNIDSIYDGTLLGMGGNTEFPTLNQMLYGANQLPVGPYDLLAGYYTYYRTWPGQAPQEFSTQYALINFYYGQINLYDSAASTLDSLVFRQHNSRYEVQVSNATPDSRILLNMYGPGFQTFTQDTSFSYDLKYNPLDAMGNEINIDVTHQFSVGGNTFEQILYNQTHVQDRLEITRVEITTPTPSSDTTGGDATQWVFVEENFVPGDTIVIGGN